MRTILSFAIVKPNTARGLPPESHTAPTVPSRSASWAARAPRFVESLILQVRLSPVA
jgi:hypothetical protein